MGGKTDLKTVNLNLSGAYRLTENWSFGLGFDAVYADAKIERNAGDAGMLAAGQILAQVPNLPAAARPAAIAKAKQLAAIPADTQIARLKGSEWGYGWNAGILYELDKNNRWGLTYRSEVKIDFDGDYNSNMNTAIPGFPYPTGGRTVPGSLTLNLPEMWEVSGYNRVAP